ncbi:Histone-lysine N-methyltransferase ATX1 [Bienertia sinuspersici]
MTASLIQIFAEYMDHNTIVGSVYSRLVDLERHLIGEGSHRRLASSIKFSMQPDLIADFSSTSARRVGCRVGCRVESTRDTRGRRGVSGFGAPDLFMRCKLHPAQGCSLLPITTGRVLEFGDIIWSMPAGVKKLTQE